MVVLNYAGFCYSLSPLSFTSTKNLHRQTAHFLRGQYFLSWGLGVFLVFGKETNTCNKTQLKGGYSNL